MTSKIEKSNAKWLERDYNKEKKRRAEANLKSFRTRLNLTEDKQSSIKFKQDSLHS